MIADDPEDEAIEYLDTGRPEAELEAIDYLENNQGSLDLLADVIEPRFPIIANYIRGEKIKGVESAWMKKLLDASEDVRSGRLTKEEAAVKYRITLSTIVAIFNGDRRDVKQARKRREARRAKTGS